MTLRRCLFDVAPDGTTLNAANTKFTDNAAASLMSPGTGSFTSSSLHAHAGGFSLKVDQPSGSTSNARLPFVAANDRVAFSFYHWFGAAPPAQMSIATLRHSGGVLCTVNLLSSGRVYLTSSLFAGVTGNNAITFGQFNRFEVLYNRTTGAVSVNTYTLDGTAPTSTTSITGAALGTNVPAAIDLGTPVSIAAATTQWFDSVQMDDGATAEIGPYSVPNNPPTLTLTGNQDVAAGSTVTAAATATDTDGTIASYAWTVAYSSGTAPTLTGASTANVSLTAPAAGNLVVLQCVVTDNLGSTATKTTEVRVPTSGNAAILPSTIQGATWTNVGGAANEATALNDTDDSTYVESPDAAASASVHSWRLAPMTPRSTLSFTQGRFSLSADGTITVKLRLYEGTTLREEWTLTKPGTTPADQKPTVTNPSAISDWGNLRVELSEIAA